MTVRAGVGLSIHRNPTVAAKEAVSAAMAEANMSGKPDAVIAFGTVGYDQQALVSAIRKHTSGAPLVGGSMRGVITHGASPEENFSVLVMVLASEELWFAPAHATGMKADAARVGAALTDQLAPQRRADARALFTFVDGINFNFVRFAEGLSPVVGAEQLPILGGMCGDNFKFERTYQYHDDHVVSDGASALLMGGATDVIWAASHGCVPLGKARTVTRCAGNVIHEIDGKASVEVLKEYLSSSDVEAWSELPVALSIGLPARGSERHGEEYVVRMPIKAAEGAISLATEVVNGDTVYIMRRDHDKVHAGLQRTLGELDTQLRGRKPKLVFQFDCAARGKMMFRQSEKELLLKDIESRFVGDAPWFGAYTYGEIGPVGGRNSFHNQTAIVGALV